MFSGASAVRMLMALAKVAVMAGVVYVTIRGSLGALILAGAGGAAEVAVLVGDMVLSVGLRVGAALLALAAVDYLYQRWRHRKDLKMTRREFLEELRNSGPRAARPGQYQPRETGGKRAASAGDGRRPTAAAETDG